MADTRHPSYGTVDREYAIRLATTPPDEDGPVWMVNLMHYHERAAYADGDGNGDGDGAVTGREADDRYAPTDVLRDIGAEIVFVGDVDQQLLGESPVWDRVAVVKYPTRRSFIEMQQRRDFQERHVHKEAGMRRTIVIGCRPMDVPNFGEPLPRDRWYELEFPPTDDDGPVMVLHVIRFEDLDAATAAATPEHMATYTSHAATVAAKHGGRIAAWFAADGTIVGDGRAWHQVRFNAFPSKRAFMAVVMDPDRLAAQREHREAAIADTYTMILRPTVDRLTPG
jgi:uncharacterized protein (DUF1330 family)